MELREQLKPREIEILRLMADGLTNREISEQLYIGVGNGALVCQADLQQVSCIRT